MSDILQDLQHTLNNTSSREASDVRLILRPSFIEKPSTIIYNESDTDISTLNITKRNTPHLYDQLTEIQRKYTGYCTNHTYLSNVKFRISTNHIDTKLEFTFPQELFFNTSTKLLQQATNSHSSIRSPDEDKELKSFSTSSVENYQQVKWGISNPKVKLATNTELTQKTLTKQSTIHQTLLALAFNRLQNTLSNELQRPIQEYRLLIPTNSKTISFQLETTRSRPIT